MTRNEFALKVKDKIDLMVMSKDVDYEYESIPMGNNKFFVIYCSRITNGREEDIGEVTDFEFYVEEDDETIEAITATSTEWDKCKDDVDYVLLCTTNWK